MTPAAPLYTRLTRNTAGVGSYSSLWLAADHVMIVRSTGYQESYARLQLRDFKALFLVTTDRRMWWSLAWGAFAVPGILVAVVSAIQRQPPLFSAFFAVLGVAGLIGNHLLGPGCKAYVMTGVQTAELPALVRIKKARRVITRLQPLIQQAQADLAAAPAVVPPTAPAFAGITPSATPALPDLPPNSSEAVTPAVELTPPTG
jgi:hypothetical protein